MPPQQSPPLSVHPKAAPLQEVVDEKALWLIVRLDRGKAARVVISLNCMLTWDKR